MKPHTAPQAAHTAPRATPRTTPNGAPIVRARKAALRGSRTEMLADLLLDEVDDEPADLDEGLLRDVGLGRRGFGGDGTALWR